jgi:hypothetical protein
MELDRTHRSGSTSGAGSSVQNCGSKSLTLRRLPVKLLTHNIAAAHAASAPQTLPLALKQMHSNSIGIKDSCLPEAEYLSPLRVRLSAAVLHRFALLILTR